MKNVTFNEAKKVASNFKSIEAFKEFAPNEYQTACENDWIDKICKHMKNILTYEYVKYKALQCKSKTEFIDKAYSAYQKACKMKWIDDVCSHMVVGKGKGRAKKGLFSTKEACIAEASKYEYKKTFIEKSPTAYQNALKNGWLVEVCENLKKTNQWNFETCKKEALKFNSKVEFLNNSRSAYDFALRNEILDEVCSHMDEQNKKKGYWNIKENCEKEAKKYLTRTEFSKKSSRAYFKSWKNGWLDEFFSN